MLKHLVFTLIFTAYTQAFVVDQNNYFYLNTSYSKQTISLSMCFKVSQPTQIVFQSEILIPQGNHTIIAQLSDQHSIKMSNPYPTNTIGYNNYDSEQYWFGTKIAYPNPQKYDFIKLEMNFQQKENTNTYIFLLPLCIFPLNGIQIYPVNTLFIYHKQILISYQYKLGEIDLASFGTKNTSKMTTIGKKDWGFYKQDTSINYLRHKSKSKSQITFKFYSNSQLYQYHFNQTSLDRQTSPYLIDKGVKLKEFLTQNFIQNHVQDL